MSATLLTLLVLPVLYALSERQTSSPQPPSPAEKGEPDDLEPHITGFPFSAGERGRGGEVPRLVSLLLLLLLPLLGQAQSLLTAPQAVADALRPLLPRSYSVASLPQDGHVRLLVRQARHDGGLGVASGWLTAHAARGTSVAMRLVENRAFEPREEADAEPDAPAIFIGNGSGYAGLRGHLRARMHAGRHRNWLLFGERQRAHDGYCEAEVSGWLAAGKLQRADFIYSRDQARRRYVQDALREAAEPLRDWIADGAVLYVCGSADGMAAGVDAALADILGATAVEDLIVEGRYRRDVY